MTDKIQQQIPQAAGYRLFTVDGQQYCAVWTQADIDREVQSAALILESMERGSQIRQLQEEVDKLKTMYNQRAEKLATENDLLRQALDHYGIKVGV